MLGSMFSHVGGMHLLFNMIAMSTFSLAVYRSLGPAHTTALYLNAGMLYTCVRVCICVCMCAHRWVTQPTSTGQA